MKYKYVHMHSICFKTVYLMFRYGLILNNNNFNIECWAVMSILYTLQNYGNREDNFLII